MKRYCMAGILALLFTALVLSGCGLCAAPEETPVNMPAQAVTVPDPVQPEETAEAAQPTEPLTEPPSDPPVEPTPTETSEVLLPIEVTYFTPPQGEGPYYTVEKPDDRDNDLTVVPWADAPPSGDVLEFSGTVYDANGWPVPGVLIEIWQTDASGVYLHPNDRGTNSRDPNFQFYGEALTDEEGRYEFRTILPGHYEPRPRHIHVKIKFEGRELLTTQFYFTNDPTLSDEAMFGQVGEAGRHLVIALEESQDSQGKPILVGSRDVILTEALVER